MQPPFNPAQQRLERAARNYAANLALMRHWQNLYKLAGTVEGQREAAAQIARWSGRAARFEAIVMAAVLNGNEGRA